MYWIEQTQGGNYRVVKGEMGQEIETVRSTTNEVSAVAVDMETEVVYWTENEFDLGTFEDVSTVTNSLGATLFTVPVITSMAINTQNNRIYWVQFNGTLWSSDLNGSDIQQLFVTQTFQTLVALTLDVDNNNLYFIEDFDDGVNEINSKIYRGDLSGSAPATVLYEELETGLVPTDGNVTGFVDLSINGSSIYLAGEASSTFTSQILEGNLDGSSNSFSVVYESDPGSSNNPMPQILGLSIDDNFDFVYWINYGEGGGISNSTDGSIYRGPIDMSMEPELLFEGLELPSRSTVTNGRSKSKPRKITIGFTF